MIKVIMNVIQSKKTLIVSFVLFWLVLIIYITTRITHYDLYTPYPYLCNALSFIFGLSAINIYGDTLQNVFKKEDSDFQIILKAFVFIFCIPFVGLAFFSFPKHQTIDCLIYSALLLCWADLFLFIKHRILIKKYSDHFKIAIYLVSGLIGIVYYFSDYIGIKQDSNRKSFFYLIVSTLLFCRVLVEYYILVDKKRK